MQFTCVTYSSSVKTGNFTCFYAASTSRRIHKIALNKARKLHVTSAAGCRLTDFQFAEEFTRSVIADCLQLQVILRVIAGIFDSDCAGIFTCVCSYFCLRLCGYFCLRLQLFLPPIVRVFLPAILVFLPANCMHFCLQIACNFDCKCKQFCMLVAGKFS